MRTIAPKALRDATDDVVTDYTTPSSADIAGQLASDVVHAAEAAAEAVESGRVDAYFPALLELTYETVVYGHEWFARSYYGPTTYGRILELAERTTDADADELVTEAASLKAAAERAYEQVIIHLASEHREAIVGGADA